MGWWGSQYKQKTKKDMMLQQDTSIVIKNLWLASGGKWDDKNSYFRDHCIILSCTSPMHF